MNYKNICRAWNGFHLESSGPENEGHYFVSYKTKNKAYLTVLFCSPLMKHILDILQTSSMTLLDNRPHLSDVVMNDSRFKRCLRLNCFSPTSYASAYISCKINDCIVKVGQQLHWNKKCIALPNQPLSRIEAKP